jgi:RHS repeat-associated protein
MARWLRPVLLGLVLEVPATQLRAQFAVCETYIAITQYPPDPYYQTTAYIAVAWGFVQTGGPACIEGLPPEGSTFRFLVNGVDRTGYFNVTADGASGTVPLVSGLNTLLAEIQGYDTQENPRTEVDVKTTNVFPGASPQPPFVDVQSVNPGSYVGRHLCLTMAAGSQAAYECADLRIVHPLTAVRTLGQERIPTLLYNSDHAHPWPVVLANVQLPSDATVPDSVVARLLVNNVERKRSKWTGSEWTPGEARRIVLHYDGLNDVTGVYPYVLEVTNWYGSSPQPHSATGELVIVNRSTSPFGAGWWLAGLEQLFWLSDGRKLMVGGDGSAHVYTQIPGIPNLYTAVNPVYPDTLDGRGTDYVRIAPHGVRVHLRATDGRHVKTVSRLSHETAFSYYGDGRLYTIGVPPSGSALTYNFYWYNPGGTLSEVRISSGQLLTTSFAMDAGRLTRITEPSGDSVKFGYTWGTMPKRVTSRTDRRGTTTTYDYDQTGRKLARVIVQMVTGPNIQTLFGPAEMKGQCCYPSYDTSQVYTRVDGPRPVSDYTDFWLDRFGAPRRIKDALWRFTELWRTDGNFAAAVTRVRYPDGRVLRATYNQLGLVSTVTDSSHCQGGQCATTSYEYDAKWGFVTMIAPPERDTVFLRYDPTWGNRIYEFNVGRDTVKYYYGNTWGLLSSIERPGQTARDSFAYDARANLQTVRSPSGLVTTYVNDHFGFLARKTSPGGVVDSVARDARTGLDTLVRTWGPTRSVSDYWSNDVWPGDTLSVGKRYDAEGNLIETRRQATGGAVGALVEQTRYDRANRPVATVAVDGRKDSVRYDEAGNRVEWITRRQGHIHQDFDLAGQLTQRRIPSATYNSTQWNGWVWPAESIPGDTIRFYYDAAGRDTLALSRYAQVRRRYAEGGLLTWEEQRVRSWAQRSASTWSSAGFDTHVYALTFDYDLNGRRTYLGHPPALGPGTDATSFTYHPHGPLATITDPYGGVFRFVWDQQGRLDSLTRPTTYPIGEKLRYDLDGRLQYRTVRTTNPSSLYRDGGTINADTIVYTPDGLVTFVRDGWLRDSIVYTGLGQVGRTVRWYWGPRNGTYQWIWTDTERFDLDAMGNTIWRNHATVADPYAQNSFAYGAGTGRLIEQGELYWGDWYDEPVTYDWAGNQRFEAHWKLASQCADGDARVCWSWNQQHKQWFTASYYDAEQRLVAVRRRTTMSLPNGDQAGGSESYWYDPYGRRILRGWLSDGYQLYPGQGMYDNHLYRYVWDGSQILYEIRSDGELSPDNDFDTRAEFGRVGYVHGLGTDSPLEAFRADGGLDFSRMFLHPDWRGTITMGSVETGAADGYPDPMIDWKRRRVTTYAERGLVHLTGPYRYFYGSLLDRQWDRSGLQYLRNRYYDPQTGRFTQEDPIGLAGGLNLYGFANGDPVNFSDPFGLCPIPILCEAIDVAAIGLDIRDIRRNGLSWGSGLALAADVGGLLLPVVPAAAGATYRGGRAAARAGGAATRIERHHQLPRAFRQQFERAGLDIEKFTVDLPVDAHRLKPGGLHTGSDNWNKQWKGFFEQNDNPTQQQILDQLDRMRREFGLDARSP